MIDSHVNVIINPEYYFNNTGYGLEHCLKEMGISGVNQAVIFLNPAIKTIFCTKNLKHRILFEKGNSVGKIKVFCLGCGNILYEGENPYRRLNENMINAVDWGKRTLYPIVYLPLVPENIEDDVRFFERKYRGKFFGYKIQPSLSNRKVTEIETFDSNYPVFIHLGKDDVANPLNVIPFALKYNGNVVITHFAKFNKEIFRWINSLENLYMNTSPASLMFETIIKNPKKLFSTAFLGKLDDVYSLYRSVLKLVDENKVVYGSDYPVSSIE